MLVGYGIWLTVLFVIIVTTPVHSWVAVSAITFTALTATSFMMALQRKGQPNAAGYWMAPVLPAVTSAYILLIALI